MELEQTRKLLNERREKRIEAAKIKRQNEQIVQDRLLEEKSDLDSFRKMKREIVQNRLEEDLIFKHADRDGLSASRDFFMRSVRRIFVLMDVNGDGVVSKV